MTRSRALIATALVTLFVAVAVVSQQPGALRDWPQYGGDAGGMRYSALDQVSPQTVSRLAVAWTYDTGETSPAFATRREPSFEATPIVIEDRMYLSTPLGRVIALDATTGKELWVFDARIDRNRNYGDFTNRGVSTWIDRTKPARAACRRVVYLASVDARLFALDAATGLVCPGFGKEGVVDLRVGLRNAPFEPEEYEVTSPVVVIDGLVIVGSAVADNNRTDAASGEVRAFDARTGALRWKWDPVTQDTLDPAYITWRGPNAHRTGGANVWSVMVADTARRLVFLPTTSPSPDYFGGERRGENRYANSLVALNATTGAVAWHFQTVHHDIWDYDNASPPLLIDVRRDNRIVPAVLLATKTGMLFAFNRTNGEPLIPANETPVPGSSVPGEEAWPTQPVSTVSLMPPRFTKDQVWGTTPEDRAACASYIQPLRDDGPFTPPSLEGSLVIPSNIGGAHWGGMAADPVRQIAVVPVNRLAAMVQLIPVENYVATEARQNEQQLGDQYTRMRGTPYVMRRRLLRAPSGLPCTPPPFGTLIAINLNTGARLWEVPLGTFPGPNSPPSSGSVNLGGPIVTAGGLVFIAATLDRQFRAFDLQTGAEVWNAPLPAGGKATPMTYLGRDGRQYIVIAAGGGPHFGRASSVIAFALSGTP